MEYGIEVDYIANGSRITNYSEFFEHVGGPIDACNCKIREFLEVNAPVITRQNLVGARVCDSDDKPLLSVDYRKKGINLKLKARVEDFWIKI